MNRWNVIIGTPGRSWSVNLPAGRTVVGQGHGVTLSIAEGGLSDRHASLLPRNEGVLVEPLRGHGELWLNDVPLNAQGLVRSGDELRLAETRLIFTLIPDEPNSAVRLASHDELLARLDSELRRAQSRRPTGLAMVSSPDMNVSARQVLMRRVGQEVMRQCPGAFLGELASDLFAIVLPELGEGALRQLLTHFPQVVGPRAQVATALAPVDGVTADALLGFAWGQLCRLPEDQEPLFESPSMIRLAERVESLAESDGSICLVGPPGSGRRTLLRRLAHAANRELRRVSAFAMEELPVNSPWLLISDIDSLPSARRQQLMQSATTRVFATAQQSPEAHLFTHVLEVPPLRARTEDILPLADAFLAQARGPAGRARLSLNSEARASLLSWHWPGNVQELSNVMLRAARVSVRDEIGQEALSASMNTHTPAPDFRGALQSAERDLLLETLVRTRWNVTAAATRLGLPRRTIVHRIAKLGLKRPARAAR